MLTIRLPSEVCETITSACRNAGQRETGGMLFGEHLAENEFRVVEATVAGKGSVATFLRTLVESLTRLETFFRRTKHEYRRFNYLGEWHSHPSFALHPSGTDDESMFDIVDDPRIGARFAVSVIVKMENERLDARAFAYFPGNERENARAVIEA
jgi:proteasome lid subunit RPN8/RPN11